MELTDVKNVIEIILPNITSESCKRLLEKLAEIGVESREDLPIVREEDLSGILKPIQMRKLMNGWATTSRDTSSSTSEAPRNPSTSVLRTPTAIPSSTSSEHNVIRSCILSPSVHDALQNYTVPWNRLPLPKQLKTALSGSTRLLSSDMRKLVKIIAADILVSVFKSDRGRPGKQFLDRIAKETMIKYPGAITTVLDNQVVGSGYDSLLQKLVNKFDNVNRGVTSSIRQKRAAGNVSDDVEDSDNDTPRASSRCRPKLQKLCDKYGCIAWQPAEPDDINYDEVDVLRLELEDFSGRDGKFDEKFMKLFFYQRQDINGSVPVVEIKGRWPFLFTADGLFLHFRELTGIDVEQTFTKSLESKIPRLLAYFHSLPEKRIRSVSGILASIDSSTALTGNKFPEVFGVIRVLAAYFGEDDKDLFVGRELPLSDIDSDFNDVPPTPFIIATGNLLTSRSFHLLIDRMLVNEIRNPARALAAHFAAFYVFNMVYTPSASVTLEFIQRFIVGINPERGSKTKKPGKHHHDVNPKLLNLINSIAAFEWAV